MTRQVIETLMTVLDEEHAVAVEEFRRVTKKAKLTPFAAKILAKRLAEWGDPNQAAEIMIEKCWRGFRVEWVKDQARPQYRKGRRNFADVARDRMNEDRPNTGDYIDAELIPARLQ